MIFFIIWDTIPDIKNVANPINSFRKLIKNKSTIKILTANSPSPKLVIYLKKIS